METVITLVIFFSTIVLSVIAYLLKNLLTELKNAISEIKKELMFIKDEYNRMLLDMKSNYYSKHEIDARFITKDEHQIICKFKE